MNQLFAEMNPTERIPKVIKEFIFPSLEKKGFRILKSGLSIKRTVGIFNQEIWFSKSKWNIENEICAFTPQFNVTLNNYKRWHLLEYGLEPTNVLLESHAANYIDGWNTELFDNDNYDLAKDDNYSIVELVRANILNYGLPLLEQLSHYKSASVHLMTCERYFLAPKIIDICIINKDIGMAKRVLDWFRNYQQRQESEFMDSTLNDMELREIRINSLF